MLFINSYAAFLFLICATFFSTSVIILLWYSVFWLQMPLLCNQNTEYHQRIIKLVEKNVAQIKKRNAA
jgi:hypothetical protein